MDDPLFFARPEDFEAWLEQHGTTSDGVWIKMAKKHTGVESLDWTSAVEVVLCFGWIDGQLKRIDDDWFMQRFTPRRARSTWSKVNTVKVQKLIAEGRMRPAGQAEIDRAKADGRWDAAYDSPKTATVPDDLAAALDAAGLRAAFDSLKAQERYSILYGVQNAKRPETRAARIEKALSVAKAAHPPEGV